MELETSHQAAPAALPGRGKRAPRACVMCRTRKIRCDGVLKRPGESCSYCKCLGTQCQMLSSRRKRDQHRRPGLSLIDQGPPEPLLPRGSIPNSAPEVASVVGPEIQTHSGDVITTNTHQTNAIGGGSDLFSEPNLLQGNQLEHQGIQSSTSLNTSGQWSTATLPGNSSSTPSDGQPKDNVWTLALEEIDAIETNFQDSGQTINLAHPDNARRIAPRSESNKWVVYSDEVVTHFVLPHMTGHRSFKSSNRTPAYKNQTSTTPQKSISLVASPIPGSTWIHLQLSSSANCFSNLAYEDVMYLTEVKHCLAFPPVAVIDDLFEAFVVHFLPAFPVFDRHQLRAAYDELACGHITSPLVLNAILFSACHYVPMSTLEMAGFSSRQDAKAYFHQRATLLYSFNCESIQLKLLQSIILISNWWSDYAEEKETRYWISNAANLAVSMGLHKAVPLSSKWKENERSMWRKIFWTIFVRDVNIAVGLGRPRIINLDDVDTEPLKSEDFYDVSGSQTVSDLDTRPWEQGNSCWLEKASAEFMIELVRVSKILYRVLEIGSATATSDSEKIQAFESLRNELFDHGTPANNSHPLHPYLYTGDSDLDKHSPIWTISLELNKERILSLVHRTLQNLAKLESPSARTRLKPEQHHECIVQSAGRTIAHFECLLRLDLLRYSHGFLNTAFFSAIVTYLEEIKLNPKGSWRRSLASSKVQFGLLILEEMRLYWPQASWAYELIKYCSDNNFELFARFPRPSRWQSPSSPQESAYQEEPFDFNFSDFVFSDASVAGIPQWFNGI